MHRSYVVKAEDFVRRQFARVGRWALHRFGNAVSVLVDSVAAGQVPDPEFELEGEAGAC